MNRFKVSSIRFSKPFLFILIIGIIAAVACGASGKKQKSTKPTQKATSQAPLKPLSYDPKVSLAPLVERVSPAVVNIKISKKVKMNGLGAPGNLFDFFFGPRDRGFGPKQLPEHIQKAMGSGFIIDSAGYVVTNHHVVYGADEIEVMLADERTFEATIVGSDERTDVALLKLKNANKLPTVKFGKSDNLKVGDHVVAIGNPFGLDHTVTSGIVSAKERVIGAGPYDDFIQTDASINPGNSGGPLFNLAGEVIGINTAISRSGQGIGFAIPSDLAKGLIDSIRQKGKVVRGWLGIVFQPLDDQLAKVLNIKNSKGALITNVTPNSPAEKSGLKERDVIVKVNGRKLKSSKDLPTLVAALRPNKTYSFGLIRDGKEKTIIVKVGAMPDNLSGNAASKGGNDFTPNIDLGFNVAPLDSMSKSKLGAENLKGGVLVTYVSPDKSVAKSLSRGDIIVEVNRKPVLSIDDFKEAIKTVKKGDDLLVLVFRQGGWMYRVIKVE